MQKVRVQRLPELRSELNVSKMDGRGPPVIFLHEEAFVPHSDAASDNRGGPVERTHTRWNSCVLQQAEGGVFGPSWPEMWCCWSRRDPQKYATPGTWSMVSEGCFFYCSPQQSLWSSSHWGGLLVLTPLDQLARLAPAVGSIIVGHEVHHNPLCGCRFHCLNKAHVKYIDVSWDHLMGLLYKCSVLPYQGRYLAILSAHANFSQHSLLPHYFLFSYHFPDNFPLETFCSIITNLFLDRKSVV